MPRALLAAVVLVAGATTIGCAPSGSDVVAGSGSGLEPDFKPGKRKDRAGDRATPRRRTPKATPGSTTRPSPGSPTADPTSRPTKDPTQSPTKGPSGSVTTPATPTATPVAGGSASVQDGTGDVRSGLTGAPAYADIVGAAVTRTAGGFEVRVQVAAPFPAATDGSNVENVVAFFDIDLDGQVDYETWGHLADEGWGASGRAPDGARFGPASGVTATPAGDTLVLAFPASVIGDPTGFQFSVATEYGSVSQVASGTTATDFAPDSGGVGFPA